MRIKLLHTEHKNSLGDRKVYNAAIKLAFYLKLARK